MNINIISDDSSTEGMEVEELCNSNGQTAVTHFYSTQDHCKVAFDTINRMRQNTQVFGLNFGNIITFHSVDESKFFFSP